VSDYILTVDYFDQVTEWRPDGTPLRLAKHRKGAVLSNLSEDDVERLLDAGAIREHRAPVIEDIVADEGQSDSDGGADEGQGADEPGLDAGQGGDDPSPAPVVAEPATAVARPAKTAVVAEWRRYAIALGLPEADAADMTRAELVTWAERQ